MNDNHLDAGYIENNLFKCYHRHKYKKYNAHFDAYYCQYCDSWLEGVCKGNLLTDEKCYCNCATRPNKPSEIMTEPLKPLHTFEFYAELPEEAQDSLRSEGIEMSDWDYILFFPFLGKKALVPTTFRGGPLQVKDETLGRLLTGCYKDEWYYVDDFCGRSGVIGIAYHS